MAVIDPVSSGAQLMTVRHRYGSTATEVFVILDSPPSTVQGTEYSVTSYGRAAKGLAFWSSARWWERQGQSYEPVSTSVLTLDLLR